MPITDIRGQPFRNQYMDHVTIRSALSWSGRVGSTLLERLTSRQEALYCRFCNFLSPRGSELILHELLDRRGEFRARGSNAFGTPAFYRTRTRLDPFPEFLNRFAEVVPVLERWFGTDLRESLIELLGQAYNDGSFFRKHSDAGAGGPNWQRRLSGVYYLHARPRKFEGGSLALYDRRGNAHLIDPEHNSVVFFPRDVLHEVLPVRCASKAFEDSRFAINVWIS
jgi:SM-20-related protein